MSWSGWGPARFLFAVFELLFLVTGKVGSLLKAGGAADAILAMIT